MLNLNFTKREKKSLLISILIISLAFAYEDKSKTFEIGYWFLNLVKTIIIVAIALLIHEYAHKYLARNYGAVTEHQIWSIKRYGLKVTRKLKRSIPVGIIIPLLVTLFSFGKLFFPLTSQIKITSERKKRIGRKFQYITNYETAKIAAFASLVNILFSYILKTLSLIIPLTFSNAIFINNMIAIFSILPIPKTNGSLIFFGSKNLYVLTLSFIIFSILLINYINPIITIIISLIIAFLITISYFSKFEI